MAKLFINVDTGKRITANGSEAIDRLSIIYQTQPSWTIQVNSIASNGLITGANLSDAVAWEFSIDKDYDATTDLMCLTQDANINKTDMATGKLIVAINTNTASFHSKLGALASLNAIYELKGFDADGAIIYCFQGVVTCSNLVNQSVITPIENPDNLITQAQALSMLRAAPEFQFSVNGTSYHSTQTANDLYYQYRYPEGVWSDTIAFLRGIQGIQGIQGLQGIQGETGLTGKSAYEIAVLNGFVGNETAWLLSLHGTNGTNGSNGTNGLDGQDGVTPLFISGSFDSSDLVANILTISHTSGNVILPYIITDNNGKNITFDSQNITFSSNQITVDFTYFSLSETDVYHYCFGGLPSSGETIAISNKTASYSLILSDAGKLIRMNTTDFNTVTVPSHASVAFPVGSIITVKQVGTGTTFISGASGVTINGISAGTLISINAQNKAVCLVYADNDEWDIIGAFDVPN